MKRIKIHAIIITDGVDYLIHGTKDQSPADMFKTMSPLWPFDPSNEVAHYLTLEVDVPEFEMAPEGIVIDAEPN